MNREDAVDIGNSHSSPRSMQLMSNDSPAQSHWLQSCEGPGLSDIVERVWDQIGVAYPPDGLCTAHLRSLTRFRESSLQWGMELPTAFGFQWTLYPLRSKWGRPP